MAFLILIVLFFIAAPFLSAPFVIYGLFRGGKYKRVYGLLFAILIGILVYHIIPSTEMDLSRYYAYLNELKQHDFWYGLSQIWTKNDPLSYSLMFIVATAFNNNAITFMTSIIGYSVFFYILYDYARLKALNLYSTGLVLIFFLGAYSVINSFTGIRFALGAAVFILGLYFDVIKRRRKISFVLYVLSPLFHSSMITLLMIRVVSAVFKKSNSVLQYVLILLAGLSSAFLQQLSYILSSVPFLNVLSSRADFYLLPAFPSGFWYPFNITITALMIAFLFRIRNKKIINSTILKVNLYVLIVALANVTNYYIAHRYIIIGTLLFIINLVSVLAYIRESSYFETRRIFFYLILITALLVLVVYYSFQITFLFEMDYDFESYSLLKNIVDLVKL